jgi:hypothetical protein
MTQKFGPAGILGGLSSRRLSPVPGHSERVGVRRELLGLSGPSNTWSKELFDLPLKSFARRSRPLRHLKGLRGREQAVLAIFRH